MMQACLNGLLLLFTHRSMLINFEAVVDRFAGAHPKHLMQLNPLAEEDWLADSDCPVIVIGGTEST